MHLAMNTLNRGCGISGLGVLQRIVIPRKNQTAREREVRFLVLGVFLSLIFCAIFAGALLLLNKQGRI
jgi:hypothetical protein